MIGNTLLTQSFVIVIFWVFCHVNFKFPFCQAMSSEDENKLNRVKELVREWRSRKPPGYNLNTMVNERIARQANNSESRNVTSEPRIPPEAEALLVEMRSKLEHNKALRGTKGTQILVSVLLRTLVHVSKVNQASVPASTDPGWAHPASIMQWWVQDSVSQPDQDTRPPLQDPDFKITTWQDQDLKITPKTRPKQRLYNLTVLQDPVLLFSLCKIQYFLFTPFNTVCYYAIMILGPTWLPICLM